MPLEQRARWLLGPRGCGPELREGFSLTGAGPSSEASSWGTTCTLPLQETLTPATVQKPNSK